MSDESAEVKAWLARAKYTGPPFALTKWEAFCNGFIKDEPSDEEADEPSEIWFGPLND